MLVRGGPCSLLPTRGHVSLRQQEKEGTKGRGCGGRPQEKSPPGQKRGYVGYAEGRGVCPEPGVEAGEEREKFSQIRFVPGRTRVRRPCFVVVVTSLVLFPSFLRRGETEVADEVGSPARTGQAVTRRRQILMRKVMLPFSRYCNLHAQKTTVLGLKLGLTALK